jgi:malonyl-CoA decarboxylase
LAFLKRRAPFAQLAIGGAAKPAGVAPMESLCRALLSGRGEASGVAIAADLLAAYDRASDEERHGFFVLLADAFGPDAEDLARAVEHYRSHPREAEAELARASEPRRQELLRRLNSAPGATARLVAMRADLHGHMKREPGRFDAVDADFVHLFSSWFNRGFLRMEEITWDSPARLLERVIRYEAVHHIRDWADLRGRLDPDDRRCFAFFHPSLPGEPLIFVEVALTQALADNIQAILRPERPVLRADDGAVAVFYSISNCQPGLRGISFGHFLIKQVAADLQRSLPHLRRFSTLSPIPGFRAWLRAAVDGDEAALLAPLDQPLWWERADAPAIRQALLRRVVAYLTEAKDAHGRPLDPVARFHLGNGARLERVNWLADTSSTGLEQSAGLMVNYVYNLRRVEELHEAFAHDGVVAVGLPFRQLVKALEDKGR